MPFYPTSAPGGQFSGNTLRPTGPMPMQAQQGAQLNSPTPAMGPAAAGGQAPTVPGVPPGGFQNPAYIDTIQRLLDAQRRLQGLGQSPQLSQQIPLGPGGNVVVNQQGQRMDLYPSGLTPAQRVQRGYNDLRDFAPQTNQEHRMEAVKLLLNPNIPPEAKSHLKAVLGIR